MVIHPQSSVCMTRKRNSGNGAELIINKRMNKKCLANGKHSMVTNFSFFVNYMSNEAEKGGGNQTVSGYSLIREIY